MYLLFALLFSLSAAAQAETVSCNGNLNIPTGFVNGNCSGGQCNLYLPGSYVSTSGYCSNGSNFSASAFMSSTYINGRCMNGMFSAYAPGAQLQLTGNCSNRGQFSGSASVSSPYFSGSCSEDGNVSLNVMYSSTSIQGYCTSYPEIE